MENDPFIDDEHIENDDFPNMLNYRTKGLKKTIEDVL